VSIEFKKKLSTINGLEELAESLPQVNDMQEQETCLPTPQAD
jgi:hypothetical protein